MVTEYDKSCRYGFFVHCVACGAVYKDGTRPADIQEAADRFDVPGFVRDIAAMKVDDLIFTAWYFRTMPLYPSAVTEAISTGDDAFDFQVAADYISCGMAAQGMFIDMFTVDQFNFDKPFIRKGANWRRRCWTGW